VWASGCAALGYFIAAVSPNMEMANSALPAYVTVLLFFVGLLMRNQDQPVYWRWFSYLNFLRYAWSAQMINQFEGSKAIALDFQTVRGCTSAPSCLIRSVAKSGAKTLHRI
jgi:ABC-type multidrug transport system permease subunit